MLFSFSSFWIVLIIASRAYTTLAFCALFNDEHMPRMLKMLISFALALCLLPVFSDYYIDHSFSLLFCLMLLVKELAVGALIGTIFSFPLWLVENVGNLIDMQRGEQFGAIINQLTKTPSSSISKLLFQGFIVYLIVNGGIFILLKSLFLSYNIIPCFNFNISLAHGLQFYIELFSNYFYWVVVIALPILFAMFLAEIILGVMSSFIQQLNVTVIAMPIKSLVAMLLLVFYIGVIYHEAITHFTGAQFAELFKSH